MFYNEEVYLNNLDIIKRNLLNNSFSSVDSSDLLVNDTFYFDRNNYSMKSNSFNKRGSFCIKFDRVKSGDIIECECEIRKISGDSPFVSIVECDSTHEGAFKDLAKKTYNLSGEFQLIKLETNMRVDNSININFGLGLEQKGVFEIRNIKARIKKNMRNSLERAVKAYSIYKMPTGWTIRTDVWDSDIDGVLENIDLNTLKLSFDRFKLSPIPSVAENFDNNGIKYDIRVGQVNSNNLQIKIVDRTTNTLVELSTLPNYFQFYIVLNGYKYV